MMERIILYIKSKEDPSSYYRLYQYFYGMSEQKIKIVESIPAWLYRWYYDRSAGKFPAKLLFAVVGFLRTWYFLGYDYFIFHAKTVIINRRLFPRKCPNLLGQMLKWYFKRKRVIWDFDDNIILDGEITQCEKKILEDTAEWIVVTGEYLRSTLKRNLWNKVVFLPTTDLRFERENIKGFIKQREEIYDREIRLLWVGSKGNLSELEAILFVIEKAAERIQTKTGKRVVLFYVCNEKLQVSYHSMMLEVIYVSWNREKAAECMKQSHIGFMPLRDTLYTRGKAGFKAVQYLSAGIPVLASNVGFNRQVIVNEVDGFLVSEKGTWIEAIFRLGTEKSLWKQMAWQARRDWEEKFLASRYQKFWMDLVDVRESRKEERADGK